MRRTALLPRALELTTGQLIEQIKKLAIAVDSEWARRRYEQAVAERKVVGYRNSDGSGANLSGYNLPVDRVAAASGHIDTLAKAAKRAGDCRPIDHIRADLFLGMTDGTYTGLDDAAIIELLTTTPAPDADHPDTDDPEDPEDRDEDNRDEDNRDEDNRDEDEPHTGGPDDSGPDDRGPDGPNGAAQPAEGGGDELAAPHNQPARVVVGAGMELRVRLSTLLGHDQYPAELAGWGPCTPSWPVSWLPPSGPRSGDL